MNMMGDSDEVMAKTVSMFYGGVTRYDDEIIPISFAASGIAALFGAIHCIGWTFAFPSQAEQFFWRMSSIAIMCLPLASRPLFLMTNWLDIHRGGQAIGQNWVLKWVAKFVRALGIIVIILSSIIYIIARVTLLILALTSLRSLPAEAYQTVHWTTFIPHV